MTNTSAKQVVFDQKKHWKCFPSCSRLIYDDPHIFQVRSQRSSSRLYPCENCLKQHISLTKIHYQQKCSRLPPTPIDFEQINRPHTSPSNNCNWDNFMKNKSRYAIQTPYALCNLINNQEKSEDRPPFINYGGHYNDKKYGEKRTFNSLAVHQLKHHEVDDERLRSFVREQHLRQQAENYFREMEKRRFYKQDKHFSTKYRNNH